jgi:hypothetical protein
MTIPWSAIWTAIKLLLGLFKKKPQTAEQRKFKKYDSAEKVYADIKKIDKEISKWTTKMCSKKAIHNIDYYCDCQSKRNGLRNERKRLIREWERLAGMPFTQRGACP